ncbi:class I adenylate-forming enzyme family protein [Piscinibacter sakaiensis]|uniref:class I adenylate-forming enzyme family protein n=1 Tax=Piscinibacter sakaiensis TaxID=1547922 RepID=UPI003AABB4C8
MIAIQLAVQAERRPAATALVYGQRRTSYAELHARSCRVARELAASGIRRGDRVALLAHNCPQFFELMFGCAMLGAIFVPINFRLVSAEIGRILASCSPELMIAGESFSSTLAPLQDEPGYPAQLLWLDDRPEPAAPAGASYERWLRAGPANEQQPAPAADTVLMLMFSSGTTGAPKGVIYTHAGAYASSSAKIIDFGLSERDTTVVFGPLFHAGPLMDLALPLLLRGGTVVIGASRGFDPRLLLATISEQRGTVVPIYPTMLRRLLAARVDPRLDLSCLRLIITGGEAAPLQVIRGTQALFPQAEFINNYGSTEGGPVTCFLPAADGVRKIGSVGRAAFGVQIRIDDADGQPLGPGAVGEIVVRSPFVCAGYWMQPVETATRIRNGWWRTGDLAWRDDEGFLWIAGRNSDMVKTGTEVVYPIEVEQAIAGLGDVIEVGVIGVPDSRWGESLVAYIVTTADSSLTAEEVIDHCRGRLAGYKKPRHVRFVDALPRGTTSKVDKRRLREWWENPPPNLPPAIRG